MADEQVPVPVPGSTTQAESDGNEKLLEKERLEKILKAKELYGLGSRNYLVKSYSDAADELSQVCALYEELYGALSDELGMPYLLYAKSLIALALDENKVIDVPDEEQGDDDDEDDDDDPEEEESTDTNVKKDENGEDAGLSSTNGTVNNLDSIKENSTEEQTSEAVESTARKEATETSRQRKLSDKTTEESQVSSTDDGKSDTKSNAITAAAAIEDGEQPSTSNGKTNHCDDEEVTKDVDDENEAASTLQLAWEILELAAKIFSRQGMGGLPNLAEVQTELANIEFENSIADGAREDYEKALKIYQELPSNYRRAMAEIHYKIGLTYLMQQMNKEAAESLKEACVLIDGEIEEIKAKSELTAKDSSTIQDMEETKQEIWAKIEEIEEAQAQNIAEVRAALDNYIKPVKAENLNGASTSSSVISSSSKPNDISHLIKRKKPDEPTSEAEAASSPAKRPAL